MQDDLIIRHLTGETSAEEDKQLHAWVALLPANERYYLHAKKIFELSSKHYAETSKEKLTINLDQEWNHFINTISTSKKEVPVRSIIPANSSGRWLRIAATLLLIAVSGYVINYFVFRSTDIQFLTTDNTLSVSLPDGSKIMLNKHSELIYTSAYGNKDRKVTLKGEGFFEVEKDALRPFIISVNNTLVEVLGTSFNVQGYDNRSEIEVTVQKGVVRFSVPEVKSQVKLTAGQKGVYAKANPKLSSTVNSDVNFLAWNTRKIIFVENDLRFVVETLNKIYQVNITLPNNIPSSCSVTVSFDHQTLESVLNVLKSTLNLTYTINGNQIEITSVGC